MTCNKCGKTFEEQVRFCPFCGEPISNNLGGQPPFDQNTYPYNNAPFGGAPYGQPPYGYPYAPQSMPVTGVHTLLKESFSGSLFYAMCVIFTVLPILSVMVSVLADSVSFPVLDIIIVVFMWKLRDAALKSSHPSEFVTPLKAFKIITSIIYVVYWVLVGFSAVAGLGLMLGGNIEKFVDFSTVEEYERPMVEFILEYIEIFGVAMLIMAAVFAVINIFFIGNCRKCADSVIHSCLSGQPLFVKLTTVANWMLVLGVLNVLGSFGTFAYTVGIMSAFILFASNVLSGVGFILLSRWLKKLDITLAEQGMHI